MTGSGVAIIFLVFGVGAIPISVLTQRPVQGVNPISLERSADFRFGAHNGRKSDMAPCPNSAKRRHRNS